MSTTGPVHVSLEGLSSSEDMICRALRDLAARGLCVPVYGGALAISPASGLRTLERFSCRCLWMT